MTLCYEPACQEDLEPLFQLNKQLIEQYEDLSSIDYPRVLAWVRRNLQRNLSGVTRVLRDGILVGVLLPVPRGRQTGTGQSVCPAPLPGAGHRHGDPAKMFAGSRCSGFSFRVPREYTGGRIVPENGVPDRERGGKNPLYYGKQPPALIVRGRLSFV